jgi:uncharacterized damage-inducible protein DinB
MTDALLRELFTNNYWARDRQLRACGALTDEELLRPMGNSFPSIRETLVHLMAVEAMWLERWQGGSPAGYPGPEEFPTLAAIEARWREIEAATWSYLDSVDDAALDEPMTYRNFQGEPWTYTRRRLLHHLLLHQDYHRGQVTTLLRQLGKPAPMVSYLLGIDMEFRQL